MSQVKKCPKCGGDMEKGRLRTSRRAFSLLKPGDLWGDSIQPYYGKNCGYIEFFKETKEEKE